MVGVAVMVTGVPEHTLLADAEMETEGVTFPVTVIFCVVELLPPALVAVSCTVYVPAAAQVTPVGFCEEEVAGVPLGKVQLQEVGELVELSVKFTEVPTHTEVDEAVNAATGEGRGTPVRFTLSI